MHPDEKENQTRLSLYDFELPGELIAQRPSEERGDSRMMVVHRETGQIDHCRFADFSSFLRGGDLCVFNNTEVVPARFFSNDRGKEILRLEVLSPSRWECLVKPGKKMRAGNCIEIGDSTGRVTEVLENGNRVIEFDKPPGDDSHGHLALPPYISRPDDDSDRSRYQTVYAKKKGAIAAPTAGLHFSESDLAELNHVFVTLHVGLGTFRPVSTDDLSEHRMHREQFELSRDAAEKIDAAERVIAVGTTVVRVLETCSLQRGEGLPLRETRGDTDIFIYPPFSFGITGGLLTNFHLPKSTLLMLVSAFASRDLILEAYQKAVEERYRFFSYGDCMMLI